MLLLSRKIKKKLYIPSKQEASMVKDQKTRNKGEHGQRPDFQHYLVFLVLEVVPTQPKDGHTLGRIVNVLHAYCAYCTAGLGNCYHCVKALWLQYHHWGEGRCTPKPVTMDFCLWLENTQQSYNSKNPIWQAYPKKLPTSLEEAERRAKRKIYRNSTSGISGRFDPYADVSKSEKAKDTKRFDVKYNPHMEKLFKLLRK
jgi:hypothetical protein